MIFCNLYLAFPLQKLIIIQQATTMNFQNSRKTINDFSYNTNERIGKGYSCQVYRGINNKTNQIVAIKVISKHLLAKQELLDISRAQIRALQTLKNYQHILGLKRAIQTKNSIYIITQLCSRGTLAENIEKQRKFSQEKAVSILKQIINGYKMIHKHQIIHRDIKSDNILIDSNNEIKIGDFGFAMNSNEASNAIRENIGSPLYMPYQSLVYNEYSYKSDIWAIGITFFQMLMGKTPWKSKRQKQLIMELQSFEIDRLLPSHFTQKISNFLRKVLVKDVSKRMAPEQLFSFIFTQAQQSNINQHKQSQNKSLKTMSNHIVTQSNETRVSNNKSYLERGQSYLYQQLKKISSNEVEMKISDKSTNQHSICDVMNINNEQKNGLMKKRTSHPEQMIAKKTVIKKLSLNDQDKSYQIKQIHINHQIQTNKTLKRYTSLQKKLQKHRPSKVQIQEQPAYNAKIARQILFQLQSQISYFRFLFKLFKKINELKTKDQNIKQFKEYLLYMIRAKISQIKRLEKLSMNSQILDAFKLTEEHDHLHNVLNQYQNRYKAQEQNAKCHPKFKSQKEFAQILSNLTTIIYRNIIKQQNDQSHKKKCLKGIIEDLVHLSRLYLLQKELSWKQFHQKSQISRILMKGKGNQEEKRWDTMQYEIRKIIHQ